MVNVPVEGRSVGPGFGAWWMVAVLFMFNVIGMVDRLILTMLVGDIKADLLISDVQMSVILGPAFAVFYAAFGVPLGWAVDRFRRQWIIFFGVTFWGLATTASGFAESYETLLAMRICVGIGEAALAPAAISLIADAFPKERVTTALGAYQSASKIGSAAAMGVGGLTIAAATVWLADRGSIFGITQSWHLVMALVGIPGLILAGLVFTFREPPRASQVKSADARSQPAIMRVLRQHWQLWVAMLIAFNCISILSFALNSWMPTYLDRTFGWQPVQYGPALGLTNLLSAIALVANGWLVDLLYRRGIRDIHLRFYQWLIVVILPAFVLLFWTSSPYVALACYALVQLVTVPFFMYLSAVIVMVAPASMRGRMIALYAASFTLIGQGLGPLIVAIITDVAFSDEARLGSSLAIVSLTTIVLALVALRWALTHLGKAVGPSGGKADPAVPLSNAARAA